MNTRYMVTFYILHIYDCGFCASHYNTKLVKKDKLHLESIVQSNSLHIEKVSNLHSFIKLKRH